MEKSSNRKDIRHAALGAGTNFLTILGGLSELIFHPVAVYLYGTAAYGLYRLGWNTLEPFQRLSPLGSDKGLLRYIAVHRLSQETVGEARSLRTGIVLTSVTGLVLGVLALVLAEPLSRLLEGPNAASAIRWLAPALPFSALVLTLIGATMGAKVMRYNLLVRGLAQPLILLLFTSALGLLGNSLPHLCLGHLMSMAAVAGLAVLAVRSVFRNRLNLGHLLRRPASEPMVDRDMVRFSIPLGLGEFMNAIQQRADLILLGFLTDATTVGVYAAAEVISRVIANVRYAFDPVASPVLAEAYDQKDMARLRFNLGLMTRWTTLLTLPLACFFILFRADLLRIFPQQFQAAQMVFILFVAGHLVSGALGLAGFAVLMTGRSWLAVVNNTASSLTNVCLTLALVPRLGMLGAGISFFSAVVVLQILYLLECRLSTGVHPFSWQLLKAWLAGLLVFAAGLVVEPWLDFRPIWRILIGAIAVSGAFLGLVACFGLAEEEKQLIKKVRQRLRPRKKTG